MIPMTNLDIITYNVRGLANNQKRREVLHYLHKKSHNVIFLQETRSIKKDEKRWKVESGDRIYFSHGTSNASGIAIMLHKSLNIKVLCSVGDKQGRLY